MLLSSAATLTRRPPPRARIDLRRRRFLARPRRRVLESRGELPPFDGSRCGEESALCDAFEDSRELVSHFEELSDAQARAAARTRCASRVIA